MPQNNPKPGERYHHFKGNDYQIIAIAHHSETDEKMVVYQALYDDFGVCVRPYDMFISEVDHTKYPLVTQKYRFAYVGDISAFVPSGNNPKKPNAAEGTITSSSQTASDTSSPLMQFLDAKTYTQKYNILKGITAGIDDILIDNMATSVDVVIPDGTIEDRFESLKRAVATLAKYEVIR